jgi:hypothetical protein
MLFPLLEGRPTFRNPANGEIVAVHPGFRFFGTQNPAGKYANRHKLPGKAVEAVALGRALTQWVTDWRNDVQSRCATVSSKSASRTLTKTSWRRSSPAS